MAKYVVLIEDSEIGRKAWVDEGIGFWQPIPDDKHLFDSDIEYLKTAERFGLSSIPIHYATSTKMPTPHDMLYVAYYVTPEDFKILTKP